jgi:hypothetical protein
MIGCAEMALSNCLQCPERPRPQWPVRVIFSRLLSYLPYSALLDAFDTRLCHQAIELGTGCSFLGNDDRLSSAYFPPVLPRLL